VGNTAKINANGQEAEFPVISGSVGPDVIDIRKLYGQTGMFTYDPGFTSTASCESGLTYIDGEDGVLLHRGYPSRRSATSCSTAISRAVRSSILSITRSAATPCCTSSWQRSTADSGAMRTRWR
jgi:citrate synthase